MSRKTNGVNQASMLKHVLLGGHIHTWGWPSVRGSGSEELKRATRVKRLGWYPNTAMRYTQPPRLLLGWCRQLLASSAGMTIESCPKCEAVHSKWAV